MTVSADERWEQTLREERRRRCEFYMRAEQSSDLQAAIREKCRRDPVWAADNFVWTLDPRRSGSRLTPWVSWSFQRTIIRAVCFARRAAVKKTRDLGVSYAVLIGQVLDASFHEGVAHGVMSREGGEVYDGTPDSLIGKVKLILEHIPPWLRPEYRIVASPHAIVQFATGSWIAGRKTTPHAWHGPRLKTCLVDEAARVPRLDQVLRGVEGATDCPILVSTPCGPAGLWADLVLGRGPETEPIRSDLEQTPGAWAVMQLHWTDDPRKDEAWAEQKRRGLLPEVWAEQYDGAFTASDPSRIFAEYDERQHVLTDDEWVAWWEEHEHKATIIEAWDPGLYTSVVWIAVFGRYCVAIDYRSWRDTLLDDIVSEVANAGWSTRWHDGRTPDMRVADPACEQRSAQTQMSWRAAMRSAGIAVEPASFVRPESSIAAIRLALRDDRVYLSPACAVRHSHAGNARSLPSLAESVAAYRRATDVTHYVEGSTATPPPKKDTHSHVVDAWRYTLDQVLDHETEGIKQEHF